MSMNISASMMPPCWSCWPLVERFPVERMCFLASATPSVTYASADQVADFGAEQPSYDIRVYQMSASYGRGTPRAAVV